MSAVRQLGAMTYEEVGELVAAGRSVALLPVGSTEPHGPHMGLAVDTAISLGACERAGAQLTAKGYAVVIAPALPYGVTECAAKFSGAVSVPGEVLTSMLGAIVDGLHGHGIEHVCLVNNHLEPGHDRAIRAVLAGRDATRVSVACPLTRRWARTLSPEFKSGECHAGRYETSIVMACSPELVREDVRVGLEENPVSLSEMLSKGVSDFVDMGLERAYAGAPAAATAEEGEEQLQRLAEMVVAEVRESRGELDR